MTLVTQPQLAKEAAVTSLERYIDDDNIVLEQKLDGHRVLLASGDAEMAPVPFTRNGSIYTRALPKALQQFRFPTGEWALDGELVGSTYWVFDIPTIFGAGDDVPLYARRAALETFVEQVYKGNAPFRLVPQAKTREEKIALAEISIKNNYEGLIAKRKDSVYRPGMRLETWTKVKYVTTADVIVTGVRTDGKESVDLGINDGGTLKDVGRASLIGKEKRGKINVGDVLEVRYLYVGANGRLYQPTIIRKRDDKTPIECTGADLKHVNKAVLEVL